MFLSFIIPIYNCETYVASCLDGIISAGLATDEFEVVLIDDGSTDGSARICKEYERQHSNIRYIFQKNQGPATARNKGLEEAQGDFVWFVDSDDKIDKDILKVIKQTVSVSPTLELLSFAYMAEYPEKQVLTRMVSKTVTMTGVEFLRKHGGRYLWNNIYSRKAIGSHRFPDGVRHIEDSCFNIQTIIDFDHIVVLPNIGYYYNRNNVSSISNSRQLRGRIKANADALEVYRLLYADMNRQNDKNKKALLREFLNFDVAAHIFTMMRFDNSRTIHRHIDIYRQMGLYPLHRTGRWKVDAFIALANREALLLRLCNWLKTSRFGKVCF